MKVIRFGWGETGKKSSITAYKREEQSEVEVSHFQERKDGTMLIWLKSYGMASWYIETTEVAEVLKNLNAIVPTNPKIIKDTEYVH